MSAPADVLSGIEGKFSHAVIAFLDDDGYPLSVAADFQVDAERGVVTLSDPPGAVTRPPEDREVTVTFSHIHPVPGMGYDERRYISLWGRLERRDGRLLLVPVREQHWDEQEMTFFEFAERGVGQAQRYLDQLSEEQGHRVRPRLSPGWLFLRATRLPFLTATFVPVALGIAVAARQGDFELGWALLTVLAAALVHLGAQRGQRRVRHRERGRCRQRHPDAVQRRFARDPVRPGVDARDGVAVGRLLRGRHRDRTLARRGARILAAVLDRRGGCVHQRRVHGAAAPAGAPRRRRDRGGARVRSDHGPGCVLRAGPAPVVGGPVRIPSRRDPHRTHPVRQRDPRPAR